MIVNDLYKLSENLDLATEEGRIDFRYRVNAMFSGCRMSGLREYNNELHSAWVRSVGPNSAGPRFIGRTRAEALRYLSQSFITARRLGAL